MVTARRASSPLDSGVTLVTDVGPRTRAHHQLTLAHLRVTDGQALWVDARDTASTYTLAAATRDRASLPAVRVARAWTAYQHHSLVQRLVRAVSTDTALLVLPNVCSLYEDDDLDPPEATRLLRSTLETVTTLASARSIPVLLTAPTGLPADFGSFVDQTRPWDRHPLGSDMTSGTGLDTLQTTIDEWTTTGGANVPPTLHPVPSWPNEQLPIEP